MGCRCNERREAIGRILKPAGKPTDIPKELAFVATSAVEDAASVYRKAVWTARRSLTLRRR